MTNLETLAKIIPIAVVTIIFLFALVLILPRLIASHLRSQKRKLVAQRGAQQIGQCQLCGGELEAGEFIEGFYRSHGKRRPVGAVRCTRCGHTVFFS